MRHIHLFLAASVLWTGLEAAAWAQRPQVRGNVESLLPADALEKLRLNASQKEKYAKIEEDYKNAFKSAQEKIREDAKGGDREKAREAMQKLQAETKTKRSDALSKLEAALDAEQKKALTQLKQDQPRRPEAPGARVRPAAGAELNPQILERLKLTDEQQKKISDLKKDLESKIVNVLTEEQKKQLEELRKNPPARVRQPGVQNRKQSE